MVEYIKQSFADQCGNELLGKGLTNPRLCKFVILTFSGGVSFSNDFASSVATSDAISYTIRLANTKRRYRESNSESDDDDDNTVSYMPWNTKQFFATTSLAGPVNPDDSDGGDPGYWQEGFLTLQRSVDASIQNFLTKHSGDDVDFVEVCS